MNNTDQIQRLKSLSKNFCLQKDNEWFKKNKAKKKRVQNQMALSMNFTKYFKNYGKTFQSLPIQNENGNCPNWFKEGRTTLTGNSCSGNHKKGHMDNMSDTHKCKNAGILNPTGHGRIAQDDLE